MRTPLIILFTASLALASCGSFLNPRNWFGRSEPAPTVEDTAEAVNPLIPRTGRGFTISFGKKRKEEEEDTTTLITSISDVRVERVPGGAIIRATGFDPTLGTFNAKLVPVNEDEVAEDGVLTYRMQRNTTGIRTNSPQSLRDVVVARRVTDSMLNGVTTIRVEAKENALQVRR